jgi:phosphoglycolate phosphatase
LKYESIIFDIDGTLWDSRALIAEGYNIQLRKEGLHHLQTNEEVLLQLFGRTMSDIADNLFPEFAPEERYALMDRCIASEDAYLEQHPCDTIAYPDILPTMEELKKKHRLFIVSNGQKGYPQLAARQLGVDHLIEGYLSYGDTGTHKGETIRILMKNHNITDAVYVGDTQGDLEACQEAEIPFIWASFGFGTPENWYAKIERFSDLQAL